MSKVYFICGFIGSGKSTYAAKLTRDLGAFCFTPDEWMIPLFGEHMEREVFDARMSALTELFDHCAERLLELGVPVVFDYGYWNRPERDKARDWAKQRGIDFEMIYLDVDFATCQSRAFARNEIRGEQSYEMTPEMLELFWSWFDAPASDEECTRLANM
ncbi:AAA family ATPase [Vibrio astriarenae]